MAKCLLRISNAEIILSISYLQTENYMVSIRKQFFTYKNTAFGKGTQGQIGNGNIIYRQKRIAKVRMPTNVKCAVGGETHAAAIDEVSLIIIYHSLAIDMSGVAKPMVNLHFQGV